MSRKNLPALIIISVSIFLLTAGTISPFVAFAATSPQNWQGSGSSGPGTPTGNDADSTPPSGHNDQTTPVGMAYAVFQAINSDRNAQNLPPLTWSNKLIVGAHEHNLLMAQSQA